MAKKEHKGVIYILTNPSFPDYVKIGYATDIEQRLKQLNRSETIPFAFRVYAIYEVESNLTDKELHKLIDSLNPDLRTIETFDGKQRVKEFYAMSAEDAYSLLDCIAKISGTTDRLKKMKPEGLKMSQSWRQSLMTGTSFIMDRQHPCQPLHGNLNTLTTMFRERYGSSTRVRC